MISVYLLLDWSYRKMLLALSEKLNTLMPQQSILVVVGSGHLPGDDGLLDLLKRKGYTVEPAK